MLAAALGTSLAPGSLPGWGLSEARAVAKLNFSANSMHGSIGALGLRVKNQVTEINVPMLACLEAS